MKKWLPILLILWLAFGLRTAQLTAVPPGLTHDEANHGREAIGVLDGVLLYYFPLNYGSEPLYSYTVAGTMGLLGQNLFALRYVNVIFGLLAIAVSYTWAKRAFDERVGLLTAVLLAISFWPLASSREALRAGMLPFFMGTAVWLFWKIAGEQRSRGAEGQTSLSDYRLPITDYQLPITNYRLPITDYRLLLPLFALLLALTFHIYLAARVAWLIFPAFVLYLALVNREKFRRLWPPTLLGLLLTGLFVTPMFIYLNNHPESQTRLGMFRNPLGQVVSGDIIPILRRAGEAFLAFFWPGFGDHFLAYNIPGRPVFGFITGIFFLIGLGVCLKLTIDDLRFTIRRPTLHTARFTPYTFLLLWFLIGIIPSLITGSTANTTRNLAALTAVHILPALGFVTIVDRLRLKHYVNYIVAGITAVWLTFALFTTGRDYFVRWAQAPEVRSAYQHTLVEELAYWQQEQRDKPIVISTVYPGPAHDSSIGMVLAPYAAWQTRWIDARWGLIVPNGRSPQYIIPQSTPAHPLFAQWLQTTDTITLRQDDLDPGFGVYDLDMTQLQKWLDEADTAINFNEAVTLIQARWLADTTPPGGVAELLTIWQVTDPTRIGPRVPPVEATDAKMFSHVLDSQGNIVAQQDLLSVPSWQWQTGDLVLQVHQIWIAPEIAAGVYETAVGLYSENTKARVPIVGAADDRAFVPSLQIAAQIAP